MIKIKEINKLDSISLEYLFIIFIKLNLINFELNLWKNIELIIILI